MSLYKRYIKGETREVYSEIEALGQEAFGPKYFNEVEEVLNETFSRVAYNLDVIYHDLLAANYQFWTDTGLDFQKPLQKPHPATDHLLYELDEEIREIGYVPHSLKMFYRFVGGCNFGWDYDLSSNILWEGLDLIQVYPLADIVSEVKDMDSVFYMTDTFKNEGFAAIPLSADYLHKDNISGGMPYSLKIMDKPSIDAPLLYEEHETSFIDYLRICFEGGGFSRTAHAADNKLYQAFLENVRPKLKFI